MRLSEAGAPLACVGAVSSCVADACGAGDWFGAAGVTWICVAVSLSTRAGEALATSVRGIGATVCAGFATLAAATGGVDPCSANRVAGARLAFAIVDACGDVAGAGADRRASTCGVA